MIFTNRTVKNDSEAEAHKELFNALTQVQAIAWMDVEGTVTDANAVFLDLMGYDRDEIIGQSYQFFADQGAHHAKEYLFNWSDVVGGERCAGKFPCRTKSGEIIWIEASYNPLFNDKGTVNRVVLFAINVTQARLRAVESHGQLAAISKSQAVVELGLDGEILDANNNFLSAMGYTLSEVQGQNHRMFVSPADVGSQSYKDFWQNLSDGVFQAGEFMRVAKNGREVWIQASYNPILDSNGKPFKVVKFASDITLQKEAVSDSQGQLAAISKALAVIEFDLKGNILTANDNFLSALGYALDEVAGKHHSMFVEKSERQSPDYIAFWEALAEGTFVTDEFRRIGKNGKDVWIQASYNPILGPNGKPYKVVKYATNVTDRKVALQALSAGLEALLDGDLSIRLPQSVEGEFGEISEAFNATMVRLEDLVEGILDTAVSIAEDTKSIAANTGELAARNESQAVSVKETSTAIDEISSTIKSTVQNSESATNSAQTASTNAQNGSGIVKDAISAMQRIEGSASKIGQVVEVIDGIAFQTNLLALNAGVEAARAGDAGSGFAVVASEVRALAQKAAESARQINELIIASNAEVHQGSELVSNSGAALQQIADEVNDVVVNIHDIQRASREQALGIADVTNSITDIDGTIQNTAALAEESAAAAKLLAERADSLRNSVSYFKVGRSRNAASLNQQNNLHERPQAGPVQNAPRAPMKKVVGAPDRVADEFDDEGWNDF